jgi:hypothetical protein
VRAAIPARRKILESINEATQPYVMAAEILGPKRQVARIPAALVLAAAAPRLSRTLVG